jgi:hypothetical protein
MKAKVLYEGDNIFVYKDDGTCVRRCLLGQTVEVIGREGDNIYICRTIEPEVVGTFTVHEEKVEILRNVV